MSESDDDSLQNNICLTFQNDNTTMCARGPKFNSANMTGLSFRNNGLTSTMNMTATNACQERYGGSMSLRSAPIYRPSSSTYRNRMGSHRSMYNGRGESSASVHSVDTTASVISAADIIFAFNHGKLNKYDLLTIKEACNKLMKKQRRKKIEKRRKLKLFFKGMRRKSGEDSGEQGSDSSMSDDCRSIRTTICKENIPVIRQKRNFSHFGTNVQTNKYPAADVTHFRDTIKDNPIFIDRTTAIKHNTLRNMISCSNSSSSFVSKDGFVNTAGMYEYNSLKNHTISAISQKDGSEFLMPTQKNNEIPAPKQHFNKVNCDYDKRTGKTNMLQSIVDSSNLAGIENDSDEDENPMSLKLQNTTVISQKDRFKKGFLLPYQRFNQTVASQEKDVSNLVNDENRTKRTRKNNNYPSSQAQQKSDSDEEEIFRGFSDNRKDKNSNKKKALDAGDDTYSNGKKNKLDSPKIQSSKPPESMCSNISKEQSNEFIFAKPKVPVKKVNSIKVSLPEKLLAKSRVPPVEEEIEFNFVENNKSDNIIQDNTGKHLKDNAQSDITNCNSDVSLRPSFIKRKLFTQKLDMAENKNASCDSIGTNSPQNIYSASIRERSKTRKLVTSQSCLSREVPGEDNNVLELIHKIVPPDQINMTSVTNKTQSSKNKINVDDTEKWDVSTVIANCDDLDVSDTYTDEEIFNVKRDKISEKPTELPPIELPQCKIVVEKLKPQMIIEAGKNSNNNERSQTKVMHKERNKNNVAAWMKSVWDTDSDCDMQFNVIRPWNVTTRQKIDESLLQKANNELRDKQNQNIKKTSNFNSNILSVRNCHRNSKLNVTLKSSTIQINNDKQDPYINKAKSVAEGKAKSNIDKDKYGTNATSETSTKTSNEKQNVLVNNKDGETMRKPKAKQHVDSNQSDKPIKVTKTLNRTSKNVQNDKKTDNKDNNNKNIANNNKLPPKPVVKSKDIKNLDAKKNKKTTNENTKSAQKNNTKKDPVRTQPKRKSKENSYTQSPEFRRVAKKRKLSNIDAKDKFAKELAANNTTLNSTMTTRSRSKLCINSSGYNSSNNLSNISSRSLRSINREVRMNT